MPEPNENVELAAEAADLCGELQENKKPVMKHSDTKDSISSVDSDVSLSFDSAPVVPSEGREDAENPTEEDDERANLADQSDSGSEEGCPEKDSGCEGITPAGDNKDKEEEEPPFVPPDDELVEKIIAQVEFYFSDVNITKDAFLLKHVKRNKEGYVSLKLISSFKRVKHIAKDWRVVAYALAKSTKLQINEAGTKLRRVDPLPAYDQTTPSRTVVAIDLPLEKPTIENVAEMFRSCGEIALIRILRPGNPIPADVRHFVNSERAEEQQDSSNKAAGLERDISKLKEALEAKSVTLDEVTMEAEKNLKEKLQLAKKLEEVNSQVARLQEVEREMRELERRCAVDQATLSALQSDLVAEKLNTQQLKNSLDKLGLPVEHITDLDNALDKILSSPEVLKLVKQRLADGDETARGLAEQNAKLEVDVATLQSQIMSMTSQLTALQLANSQLVAEKDEVLKNHSDLQNEHQQMLVDQLTLQKLHEQLTSEYDGLVKEKEELKVSYRDLRVEQRQLKENYDILTASIEALRNERDTLREESRSLNNLRAEHSKLKDDFRNLFTASEKVKSEYRGLQEEYKNVRAEACRLRLTVTELQGELAARNDHITSLEVQTSKLSSQCEILNQVKLGLEEDRRSLMEHVSLLLSQYHELLTHSLEDKEHYHTEEKLFRDKLNSLYRQKEKLEEKIMEHYRRLDSCPTKKKSFGANLVRRVRKAGSELISKSRRSWHEAEARSGRGTDSDTSLEEVRTRQDGLSNLGTPGSRRAVYYSADENNSASANDHEETKSSVGETPASSTPQPDVPGSNMVVYNRVTNVLGGCGTPPHSPHHNAKKGPPPSGPPPEAKAGPPPVW